MKMSQKRKSLLGLAVVAAGFFSLIGVQEAGATLLTDASTGITAAQGDALTIGGYVVAAIVALAVVGLAIKMIRKL